MAISVDGDSTLVKAGLVGLLTLLLLWPLGQVSALVSERESVRDQARETIAARVGGRQWVAGPVLRVPVQRRRSALLPAAASAPQWENAEPVYLSSQDLEVRGTLQAQELRKGLHRIPVYQAALRLRGRFDPAATMSRSIDALEERLLWDEARLVMPLSALDSIRRIEQFTLDGQPLETGGDRLLGLPALAGRAPLEEVRRQRSLPFDIGLVISGSEALKIVPLSAASSVVLKGNWPHPNFDGAEATAERRSDAQGFAATWTSTRLRWTLPARWRVAPISAAELIAAGSGVALFQPLDLYTLNYRAVHYGVLFVALTFLALFAVEYTSRRVRLHPLHYLLVGLALAIFFLLLLALSEQVGFDAAYALAATALVLLIGYYIAGVTASRPVAAGVAGALATAYGLMYAILASEDQALLLGALTVFTALAALMIATRRFDWRTAARTADQASGV